MLKIRLMRIGAKGRPFYRVVAVDERNKRTGAYIELLGTYNPLTEPKEIKLKQDRIDDWIKKGAQMSDGFLRIIGKAPQRPARKPKKTPKEEPKIEPKVAESPATPEEKPVEETLIAEVPEKDQAEGTTEEKDTKEVRGDDEEGSTDVAEGNEVTEDAPGDTEPAGARTEEENKNEGSA